MNSITVAGIIGQDPGHIPSSFGEDGIGLSIADSQGKDKPTIWWNATLWGKRWEPLHKYLVKGAKITVSGSLQQKESKKENPNGVNYTTLIIYSICLQGESSRQKNVDELPKKNIENVDDIPF